MESELEKVLQKSMSRRAFLQHVGVFILTLIGVGNLLKYLSSSKTTTQVKTGFGYGANPYSGKQSS